MTQFEYKGRNVEIHQVIGERGLKGRYDYFIDGWEGFLTWPTEAEAIEQVKQLIDAEEDK